MSNDKHKLPQQHMRIHAPENKPENNIEIAHENIAEHHSDLNEALEHFIEKYDLPRKRVLLMPQASDKNELSLRKPVVFELSKTHDLGYSSRMHIEMWGNQRGK